MRKNSSERAMETGRFRLTMEVAGLLVVWSLTAATANAQRLWSVGDATARRTVRR